MKRNSTFELLRLVAIAFVFCHHCLLTLGLVKYWGVVDHNPAKIVGISLNSFFVIGVNLFILISGYFGIKFKVSKFIKLLVLILVCTLIELLFVTGETYQNIINSILHLHTNNTFVPSYIGLFLISSLLNKGLSALSFQDLKKVVILLTVMNVFIGFALGYNCISQYGYNFVSFMYMYIVGYFLKQCPSISQKKLLALYGFSYIGIVIWAYFYKSGFSAFAYNNPFVILAAVSFFLLFAKIKINNNLINKMASGVFAMFLMEGIVKSYIFPINYHLPIWRLFFNMIVGFATLLIAAYIVTYIIDKIFSRATPLLKKADDYFKFE